MSVNVVLESLIWRITQDAKHGIRMRRAEPVVVVDQTSTSQDDHSSGGRDDDDATTRLPYGALIGIGIGAAAGVLVIIWVLSCLLGKRKENPGSKDVDGESLFSVYGSYHFK